MKVLHICNDYLGSNVHANLYRGLDQLDLDQTVYAYYRGRDTERKNYFKSEHIRFFYRPILRGWHRVLYHQKVETVYDDLIQSVKNLNFDLVHATTLFSDGSIAYRLFKEHGVPYVVTVRNTDINEFLAVAPWTWPMGMNVLKNARRIVFISEAPMRKFCRHFLIKSILPEIQDKFVVQPNGVDSYWLDHIQEEIKSLSHNLIYVGRFDVNKNVVRLIHAVLRLKKQIPDIKLHLVGGDGWRENEVLALVQKYPQNLVYHGKVYDKDVLRALYSQCSVFAMPSIHETFGLVYIEALTQHLALIYTKDQGIDGLLDDRVGEKVNALSTKSIHDAICKILEHRTDYLASEVVDFERFRWNEIAKVYIRMYETIVKNYVISNMPNL